MKISMRPHIVEVLCAFLVGVLFFGNSVAYISQAQEGTNAAAPAPTEQPELPEVFKVPLPNGETLRHRLLNSYANTLDILLTKHPDDLLLKANCDLAKQRAVQDYDNPTANPLMLGAWMIPRPGREPSLMHYALNTGRETNLLVLAGKMPDGTLLQVFYHRDIGYKDDSLVNVQSHSVQKVSTAEIQKLGTVKQRASGPEVHLEVVPVPIPIPDVWPLVAAVGDRNGNGRLSNFVEVVEMQADPTTGKLIDKR